MKIKHNKKRNVGLVFEQINAVLTTAILEGDKATAEKCLSILQESFCTDSELFKELRLFQALSSVSVKNDVLLDRILREAREAAGKIDVSKLSKEKSSLIRNINAKFGKDSLFGMTVENFKSLATVQVLLNEWRKGTHAPYTLQLEEKLMTEMKASPEQKQSLDPRHTNKFVVEMAKKKFFDKYKSFSRGQLEMLFEHVTTPPTRRKTMLVAYENMRKQTLQDVERYLNNNTDSKSDYFVSKLREAKSRIEQFSFNEKLPPEACIKRALTIKKLQEELNNE